MFCKQCTIKIKDLCSHAQCAGARAQGFCSPSCRKAYQEIQAYEINRLIQGGGLCQ